jgi:hypothetical protein
MWMWVKGSDHAAFRFLTCLIGDVLRLRSLRSVDDNHLTTACNLQQWNANFNQSRGRQKGEGKLIAYFARGLKSARHERHNKFACALWPKDGLQQLLRVLSKGAYYH